jgi:hypothetical protein
VSGGAAADVLLKRLDDEREEINSKADESGRTSVMPRRGSCDRQGGDIQRLNDMTSPGRDVAAGEARTSRQQVDVSPVVSISDEKERRDLRLVVSPTRGVTLFPASSTGDLPRRHLVHA